MAQPAPAIRPRQMGHPAHVGLVRLRVDLLQVAGAGVGQHFWPEVIGFGDADRVRMVQRVFGHHVWIEPAHDHPNAPLAESIGNLARPRRIGDHHRDAHQIVRAVEIDGVDVLIDDGQIDPVRCQRRQGLEAVERQSGRPGAERPDEQAMNALLAELRPHAGVDVAAGIDEENAECAGHVVPAICGGPGDRASHVPRTRVQPSNRETISTAF